MLGDQRLDEQGALFRVDAGGDAAAWTIVSRVLLNLDETMTKY